MMYFHVLSHFETSHFNYLSIGSENVKWRIEIPSQPNKKYFDRLWKTFDIEGLVGSKCLD